MLKTDTTAAAYKRIRKLVKNSLESLLKDQRTIDIVQFARE